jgi:hypothetical protein
MLGPGLASTSDTDGEIFDQLLTEADNLIMHQIAPDHSLRRSRLEGLIDIRPPRAKQAWRRSINAPSVRSSGMLSRRAGRKNRCALHPGLEFTSVVGSTYHTP